MPQIVIDIPDNFNLENEINTVSNPVIRKALKNGKPLPAHYGDLIDRNELKENIYIMHDWHGDAHSVVDKFRIDNAETIIPATKEKSCKNCKYGKAYEHGADITTMDDECGGCCSWNDKWTPKQTATKEGDGE